LSTRAPVAEGRGLSPDSVYAQALRVQRLPNLKTAIKEQLGEADTVALKTSVQISARAKQRQDYPDQVAR
jgi:hypothetical protein